MSKTLIVIVGPTAIGKTSLAIEIATHFNTEILSSDSRQFYKEMSIGTAVPTKEELARVPHHFIHHLSIEQAYSVGDFERDAIQFISDYFKEHHVLVMVGGSGLYEKAVTEGLDYFPDVPEDYRVKLNHELEEFGLEKLQKELKEKDSVYFEEVDVHNAQRVIRALEVIRFTGKPFSFYRSKQKKDRGFNIIKIGLRSQREIIYDRINQRVDQMMKDGLLEEVKRLLPYRHLNALNTVGYKELFGYLDGKIDLDFAVSEIKKNTRRFAKRQLTWYRKQDDIAWFQPNESLQVIEHIQRNLEVS
ncbi:tRNA (adenosine(37)-N6)-dimethylallyltransferase MiaA [Flavobacteriaceae bacterium Ap0902]|nr:tRNA (adenosine(37)-N6)-dimethylallyltransferase MiaA [Flavobacteriaceae bacterium Ap0902]